MSIDWRFLSSKVARRIFALFVFCSLIPIVALSVVSFGFVNRELDAQRRERLHNAAKTSGMEVLARLETLEAEMRVAEAVLGRRPGTAARDPFVHLSRHFHSLSVTVDGRPTALLGDAVELPFLDEEQQEHLRAGKPLLLVREDGTGKPHPLLIIAMEQAADAAYLAGRLDPAFLWGEGLPSARSADTRLVVLDQANRVLHVSRPPVPAFPEEALRGIATRAIDTFSWRDETDAYLALYWWLFLKPQYGYSHWTIVVSESESSAFAPVMNFRRLLPLVVLLSLATVMLLSVVQIRRNMVPLEELRRGTREIAKQDFSCRLEVHSKDEFEDLARSFNTMASRLGRQFKTLATLGDIDRAILSTLDRREIVSRLLARLPEIVSSDCVAVTLMDASTPGHAEVFTRIRVSPQELRQRAILLPRECEQLRASEGGLRFRTSETPRHLAILTDLGMRCSVAQPVLVRKELAGIVTLGYRDESLLNEDDVIEARRLATQVAVALSNAHLIEELEQLNRETLHTLARAIDAKSPWTAGHSERVTRMSVQIAEAMGLPDDQLDVIQRGGLIHDIGKIGVPRTVLDKPGPLEPHEMDQMKDHVRIGARILEPISAYTGERLIVLYHHERYDGKGYPEGRAGEAIPLHARVLAVADVYDALISERPYRAGWAREAVVDYIRNESGKHFDPDVVEAFLREFAAGRPEEAVPPKESYG